MNFYQTMIIINPDELVQRHWKIFTKETTVIITVKYFRLLFKDTKIITLKNFKSHWKFSALLISVASRFFSVTLDF